MKKVFGLLLVLGLTGCSAIAPFVQATPTAGPTGTAQIVFQTVVVTVLVTAPATETPVPSATWTPIPTFTPQPTSLTGTAGTPQASATPGSAQFTATPGTPAATGGPTATLPADAGGTLFTNLTRSSDHFSYTCQPDTITFGISATSPSVMEVDLFYRLEYQNNSSMTNWVDVGKMVPGNSGNFTFDFKSSMIPRDLRTAPAWLDYQFVALNSQLQVIGRSSRITQQITFTPNCP